MNKFLIFIGLNFFLLACQKEEIPCTTFPCGSNNPKHYNYNRVAFDPSFRKGKWANISATVSSPDTIIFYNDTVWSKFNENGGVYEKKYDFNEIYLRAYTDINGNPVNPPFKNQTYYNDSTGVFSILIQHYSTQDQQWGHYIKIE